MIDVCGNCNSRCAYCNDWRKSGADRLELVVIKDVLRDLRHMQVKCVCFSGGEPLLHPAIDECISYAATVGVAPWLITNGILLSQSRLQRLLSSGLKCCLLSIDSLDPETYHIHRGVPFRVVQRALSVLEKTRESCPDLDVILNCVITRINPNSIPELVQFAKTKGFYILLQPYEPRVLGLPAGEDPLRFQEADIVALEHLAAWLIARQEDQPTILNTPYFLRHMSEYIRSRKMPDDFQCEAGELSVSIGANGNVYPCWHLDAVGNVHYARLSNLWHDEEFEQVRVRMRALDCPTCWTSCHLDMVHTIETLTGEPVKRGIVH